MDCILIRASPPHSLFVLRSAHFMTTNPGGLGTFFLFFETTMLDAKLKDRDIDILFL